MQENEIFTHLAGVNIWRSKAYGKHTEYSWLGVASDMNPY